MTEYVEIDAQELNDYISNLEDENVALKAQVEQLREQLEYMAHWHRCGCGHPAGNRCYDDRENASALAATPLQCLAEVKAQAIIEAIDAHKNRVMTFGFDTAIRVNDLIKYANQIRQQAKE